MRSIASPAGLHQISTDGGREPLWAPGGHELLYRYGGRILSATVATSPEFSVIRRDTLFEDVFLNGVVYTFYDITRDGKEFIFVQAVGDNSPVLVTNWLEDLRARTAVSSRK